LYAELDCVVFSFGSAFANGKDRHDENLFNVALQINCDLSGPPAGELAARLMVLKWRRLTGPMTALMCTQAWLL
jgi:hypothetical protein